MEPKLDLSLSGEDNTLQKYKSSKSNNFLTPFKRKTNLAFTGLFKNQQLNQLFVKSTKKMKTTRLSIQRGTIVYQLPNTGDTKEKDYDKISGEIKEFEMSIRRQIRLYSKKSTKKINENNYNHSIESYSSDINNTIEEEYTKNKKNKNADRFNILEVIKKFKIPPENRTVDDLYITKNFLHQTKLIEHYMKEFNNDKRIIENLTTFFGLEFRYLKYRQGQAVYKIDDYADNFYMVLLGKVELFNVEPKLVNITGYDYFCYIMNLKRNNEMHRYKLTIEENKDIFPISNDEEDLLPYFFLLFNLKDIKDGKRINFRKILEIINMKPRDLGLIEDKINSLDYIIEKEKRILKKIANFSKDKIKEYLFINNKIVRRNLKLYEYVKQSTIDPLDYFGEESIESGTPRTEAAICAEDTELVYIINKLYINNILPKKVIILEKKTAFLGKNYLFKKIIPKKFARRYFNLFSLETYNKGDILFNENNDLDYVYFIKEGHVNLLTSKSILEMEMFINEINKKIKMVQNIFNNDENNEDENNFNFFYNNIKSSSAELFDHITKKEEIKIFILKESEDAGLVSYLLGIGYLVTGIVDSPKAKIYKIKKDDLTEILRKEKLCFYELINRVEDKLKVFSKRFYEINNIKLSMVDQKIVEENNIKYNISNKTQNELNIDAFHLKDKKTAVDKLKEIIDIHNTNKFLNTHKIPKNKNIMTILPSLINKYMKKKQRINISLKKSKNSNLTKNIKNILTSLNSLNNSKTEIKNKRKQIKSFFPIENKKKYKSDIIQRFKKILNYKKKFPYEDEFMMKLTEDMNYLLENKFILTKKTINNDTNELSTYRDNNNFESTFNQEIANNNLISRNKPNSLLLTQIDNFKQKIKANHIFTQTNHKYNLKILNNNKNMMTLSNINRRKYLKTINNELINMNMNIFDNEKTNISLINRRNRIINIKHPYVSPLTISKLKRYKIIDDKDKFKENKKIYENNVIKKYEERGLNQFGFPISYDYTLSRRYNYNNKKE